MPPQVDFNDEVKNPAIITQSISQLYDPNSATAITNNRGKPVKSNRHAGILQPNRILDEDAEMN